MPAKQSQGTDRSWALDEERDARVGVACTPEAPLCQVCFSALAVQIEETAAARRLDGHPPVDVASLSIKAERSIACTPDLSEECVKVDFLWQISALEIRMVWFECLASQCRHEVHDGCSACVKGLYLQNVRYRVSYLLALARQGAPVQPAHALPSCSHLGQRPEGNYPGKERAQ